MDRSSTFLRFPIGYRIEHWILAVNFILLAITGLSQYFATSLVSQWIVQGFGGIENVRHIHHFCAIILIVETLFHLGVTRYRSFMTLHESPLLPNLKDALNALQAFSYNLGFSNVRPKEGRYTFAEKAEYWALVWGTLLMAITGFMMWNPLATTRYLPGEVIPAAKAAHGLEAILAVLAIIVWHFYFVLIKNLNMSMFTGYMTKEEMAHEHPLELADIMAGYKREPEPDPKAAIRYWKYMFPTYLLLCILIMWWVIYFAYFEETSIARIIAPEDVTVFSPEPNGQLEMGRFEGEYDTEYITWQSVVGDIFRNKCVRCHGPNSPSGLDLTSYESAMKSNLIIPLDPNNSGLITVMERGTHYEKLNLIDLSFIHIWIGHGAPFDESDVVRAETTTPGVMTWNSGVSNIFSLACAGCHGASATAGLNLATYETAIASGVFESGNSSASKLIKKMEAGGHPSVLAEPDLEIIRAWIDAGLPENPGDLPETTTAQGGSLAWDTGISALFAPCTGCHGESAMAGLNLTDYDAAMDAGVFTSGDPEGSKLIQKMQAGGHAVTLPPDSLKDRKSVV